MQDLDPLRLRLDSIVDVIGQIRNQQPSHAWDVRFRAKPGIEQELVCPVFDPGADRYGCDGIVAGDVRSDILEIDPCPA